MCDPSPQVDVDYLFKVLEGFHVKYHDDDMVTCQYDPCQHVPIVGMLARRSRQSA